MRATVILADIILGAGVKFRHGAGFAPGFDDEDFGEAALSVFGADLRAGMVRAGQS